MAEIPNTSEGLIKRLDRLEEAAWKSYELSKNEADTVRFLQLVLDTIHKRCELLKDGS